MQSWAIFGFGSGSRTLSDRKDPEETRAAVHEALRTGAHARVLVHLLDTQASVRAALEKLKRKDVAPRGYNHYGYRRRISERRMAKETALPEEEARKSLIEIFNSGMEHLASEQM